MWKDPGTVSRRILMAGLLASCLGTAAFAFNATTSPAKQDGCCMVVAACFGSACSTSENCDSGYCCNPCPE